MNTACKESKGTKRETAIGELTEFLKAVESVEARFFADHGDELLAMVFKLAFYHCDNVCGE